MASDVGVKLGVEGEKAFQNSLKAVNAQIKALGAEMAAVTASFVQNADSQQALAAKNTVLNKSIEITKSKIGVLNKEIENQSEKLGALEEALANASAEFGEQSTEALKAQNAYNEQSKKVNDLTAQLYKAEAQLAGMTQALEENSRAMEGSGAGMDELADGAERAGNSLEKAEKAGLSFGDVLKANLLSDAIAAGARRLAEAMEAVGRAALELGRQSLEGFSQFEQLSGGVKTLFGTEAGSLEEYARSVGKSVEEAKGEYERLLSSQQTVFANADNAFKTAGLSANAYMETVTSFSASLLQGLGGDTEKAAQVADQAITDMADNANKMGTDMESIQNAYQGFAKQNYTMLDNLKLGYGGTQEEMVRLINDSGVLNRTIENLDGVSFDQIIQAIHAVQDSMGITGTTAREAASTIEGSANSMKAAWQNLLTGIARDDADLGGLLDNFTQSLGTAADNILPRVEAIAAGMGTLVAQMGAQLGEQAPALVEEVLPSMLEAGSALLEGISEGISGALPGLAAAAEEILDTLVSGISSALPELVPAAVSMVAELTESAIDNVDMLVDAAIEIVTSLAEGLIDSIPTLLEKAPVIISKLVDSLVENVPKLLTAAAEIVGKLVLGIIDNLPEIGKAAVEIVAKLISGITALMVDIDQVGKDIVAGIWNGIVGMNDWIKEKVTGFFSGIVDSVKGLLGIHSPSTLFRDEIGYYIGLGVAEGISGSSDKAVKAADKMAKDVFTRSKEWADRQTKYMDLSFEEQLELWETIQSQFIQGSKQYAQAEEKIFDLKQKQQAEYFDTLKDQAERQAKYQKTSLREQLAAWRGIQDQFVQESKQYAAAEEKILDLRAQMQAEYTQKVEDAQKKIMDQEEAYQKALAQRQKEIAGAYGLFDEVAEREAISGRDLLGNLRDQVAVMKSFYNGVEELEDRGLAGAVIDEIRAMGPAAEQALRGLLDLTDRELTEYANVYMEKQQLANRAALTELEGLRQETVNQIAGTVQELKNYYDQNAPDLGLSFTDGLVNGMLSGLTAVRQAAMQVADTAIRAAGGVMTFETPPPAYADLADTMTRSGTRGGGGSAEAMERMADAFSRSCAGDCGCASPQELADAVAAALSGTAVVLDGRKVGQVITTRQQNDDRAFDR